MMAVDSSAAPIPLKKQLLLEELETLVRQGVATFGISMINVGVVCYILRDIAIPQILWIWTSAVIAFNCLRLIMVILFWRMDETADFRVWTFLYLILVYCTGLSWGMLPFFPAFYKETWVLGFIVFVIAGMSAGGIVSLYARLSAAIPYYVATIAPLIYVLTQGKLPHHFAMAFLAALFLALLIRTTYSLNGVVRRAIRLEVENRELMDFLVDARETHDKTLTNYGRSTPAPVP
jgi:hypothetical protein